MSIHGPANEANSAAAAARGKESAEKVTNEVHNETGPRNQEAIRYSDMQGAPRFPLKLAVSVKSQAGERAAETQNISANGVLFELDNDVPVGSMVDFTISLPGAVVGADTDVQVGCRGRVVRSYEENGRRGVGVVIDEYKFERRQDH